MGNVFYSWICGFLNIQYILVSLTESTGCLSSGTEQCCRYGNILILTDVHRRLLMYLDTWMVDGACETLIYH